MTMKAHAIFLHNRMRRRGVLLILTLWMVTVLSLIAYSLAYEMRLEVRLTKLKKDNLLAYQLAKAGVAKAVCDLKNDMVIDRAEGSEEFDAEGDVWKFYEDKLDIPLGAGTFSVRIIDEESLLNLNSISPFVMEKLALYFLGDGEDAEENALKIAQAVQDWRDADDTSISDQGISERQLYRQLIAEDWGIRGTDAELSEQIFYRIKNDVFTTVEELLDVYGVTPELFYGFDPEERKIELYRSRLEDRRRDNKHVLRAGGSDSESLDIEPRGLRDALTINSNSMLNINTASEAVLTAVLSAAKIGDPQPEEIARAIVDHRRNNSRGSIDNDQAFRTPGDLAMVEGLDGGALSRLQSIQRITTTSTNFRIISQGRAGSATRTIEAIVVRTYETFNVDANEEGLSSDIRRRIRGEEGDDNMVTVESPTVRIVQWRER